MLFENIPGQQKLISELITANDQQKLSHAHLFSGPAGSPSLALALAFVQYLLCENRGSTDSCGRCSACKQMQQLQHPDLHFSYPTAATSEAKALSDNYGKLWRQFISDSTIHLYQDWLRIAGFSAKQPIISAAESQKIAEKLSYKSYAGGYKFMVIWLPEKMHHAAANKLLKLIEEPEPRTLLILLSEDLESVLPTIVSRCQVSYLQNPTVAEAAKTLQAEGYPADLSKQAAEWERGNLAAARKILDESSPQLEAACLFRDWMRACFKGDIQNIHDFVQAAASLTPEEGKDTLRFFLDTIESSFSRGQRQLDLDHPAYLQAQFNLGRFAPFIHRNNLKAFHEVITVAYHDISRNVNARIVWHDCSFKISRLLKKKS